MDMIMTAKNTLKSAIVLRIWILKSTGWMNFFSIFLTFAGKNPEYRNFFKPYEIMNVVKHKMTENRKMSGAKSHCKPRNVPPSAPHSEIDFIYFQDKNNRNHVIVHLIRNALGVGRGPPQCGPKRPQMRNSRKKPQFRVDHVTIA